MHQLLRRRTIYLVAIVLGWAVLAFTWWAHQASDPFLRYRSPLLGAYLAWAFVMLWRKSLPLHQIERSTFWVLTLLWLANYTFGLYSGQALQAGWAQFVTSVMLNFFILAALSHLVFTTRAGFRANQALLAASSLIGLSRLLPDALRGVHQQELIGLIQFEVALAILIGFVYVLARSKDDYIRAELQARELRVIAYQDPLTGLPNRRQLADELDRQAKISQRYGRPLSLISFDLDGFKSINDTHGHPVGDEVLVTVASIVESLLRGGDTFGRWGGEEFLVLVPETDEVKAAVLAERIRHAIEVARYPEGVHVTASFGVITREPSMSTLRLLDEVDQRLYAAKQQGRNRVVSSL